MFRERTILSFLKHTKDDLLNKLENILIDVHLFVFHQVFLLDLLLKYLKNNYQKILLMFDYLFEYLDEVNITK